ncbi:MAG: FAD-dependent oxidoreductase [Deltaproteobacteria bacterium]|nr:FAD-dependent oxidoreductase [Deltaproteobacteria bacterium]
MRASLPRCRISTACTPARPSQTHSWKATGSAWTGNVYFAGEATSNNHPSTVIGAMESGLRAAGEIDAAIEPVPEPSFFIMVLAGGGCVLALARLRGVPLVP